MVRIWVMVGDRVRPGIGIGLGRGLGAQPRATVIKKFG